MQIATVSKGDTLRERVAKPRAQSKEKNNLKLSNAINRSARQTILSLGGRNQVHGHLHDLQSNPPNEEDPRPVEGSVAPRITFAAPMSPSRIRQHTHLFELQGVGVRKDVMNHPSQRIPAPQPETEPSGSQRISAFFSTTGFVGQNSQFSGLTHAERERLRGVEYRAVTCLAVIVPLYFLLW